ncbi:MAG: DUF4831 family protein [Bacteroidales bacterium]
MKLSASLSLLLIITLCSNAFGNKKKGEVQLPIIQTIQVQKLQNGAELDSGSFMYALPRTVFRMQIEVERDIFTHGVYAAYAQQYLGLTNVELKNRTHYTIKQIKVSTYHEADTEELYMVQPSPDVDLDMLKLTQEGLMLFPNNFGIGYEDTSSLSWASKRRALSESGMQTFFSTPEIQKAKAVENDADENDEEEEEDKVAVVPQAFISVESKTLEEQAAAAAQFLLNLRKRKYELLTGEVDAVFASNEALKVAIQEIKQMERECMTLFIGIHSKSSRTYQYDGLTQSNITKYNIFNFSDEAGILEQSGGGLAVSLEILPDRKYERTKPLTKNLEGFRVRVPDMSTIRLVHGKKELYQGRFWIYQNGKIVNMPFNLYTQQGK